MQGLAQVQTPVALLQGPELRKFGFGSMLDDGFRFAASRAAAALDDGDRLVTATALVAFTAALVPRWGRVAVAPTLRWTAAGVLVTDVDWRLGDGTWAAIAGRRTLERGTVVLVVLEVVVLEVLEVVVDVVVEVLELNTLFANFARRSVDGIGVLARGVTSTDASWVSAGDPVVVVSDERSAETGSAEVNRKRPPITVTKDPSAASRRRGRRGVTDGRGADDMTLAVLSGVSTTASSKPFVCECPCVVFMRTIIENQNHVAIYEIPNRPQLLFRQLCGYLPKVPRN